MRKISSSVKTPCSFCDSSVALNRSWPNGFSTTTAGVHVLGEAVLLDEVRDRAVRRRRRGEIEEPVAVRPRAHVEVGEGVAKGLVALAVARRDVVHALGEAPPDVLVDRLRARELHEVGVQVSRNCSDVRSARAAPTTAKAAGQEPLQREVVQRRHDLPRREVAGRAEDHERAGLRRPREPRTGAERIRQRRRDGHSVFTSWPPNWLRRAAATFIA